MKKNLLIVKNLLDTRKASIEQKKQSASLTPEQKTKLDETLAQITEAITALEAADSEATIEEITGIFAKAVEALTASQEVATAEMQAKVEAKLNEIQSKIESRAKSKKMSASLNLKKTRSTEFVPFSAAVDMAAWTPEAEIEDVEIFHPLIGVTQGFTIGTTAKTSLKIRKYGTTGNAAIVANHGVKPLIELVGAQSTAAVVTVAGVVEAISDEDLEDNPGLQNEIQNEALENMAQVENSGALALLENQAQAFANANFPKKANPDEKTALAAIIDQVKQALGNRVSQVALAMNSSMWAWLKDLRNDNGTPIDIASVIGDVQQIVDNTITGDKFYCWAKKFANIKMYKNPQVDWYKGVKTTIAQGVVTAVYSEWRTDEQSVRVRQRHVMYTSDSTTIVKGTLSGVKTAITAAP